MSDAPFLYCVEQILLTKLRSGRLQRHPPKASALGFFVTPPVTSNSRDQSRHGSRMVSSADRWLCGARRLEACLARTTTTSMRIDVWESESHRARADGGSVDSLGNNRFLPRFKASNTPSFWPALLSQPREPRPYLRHRIQINNWPPQLHSKRKWRYRGPSPFAATRWVPRLMAFPSTDNAPCIGLLSSNSPSCTGRFARLPMPSDRSRQLPLLHYIHDLQ